jgi:hypothetical protein
MAGFVFCILYFRRPVIFQDCIAWLPSKEFSFVLLGMTVFTNFGSSAQNIKEQA